MHSYFVDSEMRPAESFVESPGYGWPGLSYLREAASPLLVAFFLSKALGRADPYQYFRNYIFNRQMLLHTR
jgi:hypothetical protein